MTMHQIRIALCALVITSCGCVGPSSPVQYEADAARYDAIGLEWLSYVDADTTLTAEEKARRHRTMVEWDEHLQAAAKSLGITRESSR